MTRYSAIATATQLTEVIPDIVMAEAIATASRAEVMMQHVVRMDKTGAGDVFHLPQRAALSYAAYSSDGSAPDETQFDTAERTFTPVERVLDVVVTRKALGDSVVDLNDAIAAEVGIALAKDRDARILAIYTEAPASAPDHEIGTAGVPLSLDSIRQMEKLLLIQNAPRIDGGPSRRGFVLTVHPTQVAELYSDDQLINAATKGVPVLTEGIRSDGWVTDVLNTSIYTSDQVVLSTTYRAMGFSRVAAVGWAFKRIGSPSGGALNEVMIDPIWNNQRRAWEICTTYEAIAAGRKGSSTTTNNWMVEILS